MITELDIKIENVIYSEKDRVMIMLEDKGLLLYKIDLNGNRIFQGKFFDIKRAEEKFFEDKKEVTKKEEVKSNAPNKLQRLFDKYKI